VRKRRVESFEKRRKKDVKRGKINRKVCVWKRKKEKKGKERKKYMHEKEKNKKREEEWQERYERDESSEKKKNISARKDITLLRDETFTLFSNHVQSDNEDVIGAS
jgi:hypothetical protein